MTLMSLFITLQAKTIIHLERLDFAKNSDLRENAKEHAAGDALASFLYAIKSKETKKQYLNRLQRFFDFLEIPGNSLEEQAAKFLAHAKIKEGNNNKWAYDYVVRYFTYQKDLVEGKEITAVRKKSG